MTIQSCAKVAGRVLTLVAIVLTLTSIKAPGAHAQTTDTDPRVSIGLEIAPVPLNLVGKNQDLVGLGSYLVNAVGDCNGCHSSNAPPLALYPYVTGRIPYFHQPAKIDADVYLAGGQSFGINGGATPACIPTGPIVYDAAGDTYNNIPDGNLLQVMPWFTFSHMRSSLGRSEPDRGGSGAAGRAYRSSRVTDRG